MVLIVSATFSIIGGATAIEPKAPLSDTESTMWLLLRQARQGPVSDDDAARAAMALHDGDPFVRAMAEWTLSERIDRDNAGQELVWPAAHAPAWFRRWQSITPEQRLENDYARQGLVWGIHQSPQGLLASARKILTRCANAARRVRRPDLLDDVLTCVSTMEAEAAASSPDLAAMRKQWIALRKRARPLILSHTALDFDELLFVARYSVHSHRNITGSQYPWVHKPGGDIMRKTGFDPGSSLSGLVAEQLGPGHVHGMDLWWDAKRIVFAYVHISARAGHLLRSSAATCYGVTRPLVMGATFSRKGAALILPLKRPA